MVTVGKTSCLVVDMRDFWFTVEHHQSPEQRYERILQTIHEGLPNPSSHSAWDRKLLVVESA